MEAVGIVRKRRRQRLFEIRFADQDDKLNFPKVSWHKFFEQDALGCFAFTANFPDGAKRFRANVGQAEGDEKKNRHGLAVEPQTYDSTYKNPLHDLSRVLLLTLSCIGVTVNLAL